MNRTYFSWAVIFMSILHLSLSAQDFKLDKIATYHTGIFDEGAAEILEYDPLSQKILFTNANNNSITVLDVSKPYAPSFVKDISMNAFGSGVNSLAIHNGMVAVAVEGKEAADPGTLVLMDVEGKIINSFTVGVLPDMVIFTPDGSKILTANEGEPDDDYLVDPEGSVSIIDIKYGTTNTIAKNTLITFEDYNDKKVSLQNRGIRLYGPNASVAQDLEPEFIAITADGKKAYVSCQENNAYILIDLETNEILDILPLGYKDHSKGSAYLTNFFLNESAGWPVLGTPLTENADPVMLGGFSGLYFDASESTEKNLIFYTVPDRGPNESTVSKTSVNPPTSQNVRPFKLPNYQSRIVKFTVNKTSGKVTLDEQILLKTDEGLPISGRGNIPDFDEVPVTRTVAGSPYGNVDFVGPDGTEYHALDYDSFGGDFEGILKDKDGNFWMCDEYRPAIYKFQSDGTLIDRFVAEGTSNLGITPMPNGTYGTESLPAVYAKRRANRGFEAIAYDGELNIVYAFIQSPLYNPNSSTNNNSDVIRILGIDATSGNPVSEYVYLLERNKDSGYSTSRVDKIGDAVYKGNGKFLVIERDSEAPDVREGKKYIFEINLKGATNILDMNISSRVEYTEDVNNKPLEALSADEIAAQNIQAVNKIKVLNLPSIGYQSSDKPEGLALLPGGDIAVLNDNDFGLAGAGITDNSVLGIIGFNDNYSFDASNQVDEIEIKNWPTYGIYNPDGIASFEYRGQSYIVSANEGDSRDYDGFSEEERVKDLTLDSLLFPNAEELQANENLGRLKTTTADGDLDGDNIYDQIFSYGARSFSIWDAYGNLVWDSGNMIEQKLAELQPDHFNSTNDENDSTKNRSDDKGPEPEAIEVVPYKGRTFALVGLERHGGIMVFDISNPLNPFYVNYINNRNFSVEDAETKEVGDLGIEDIIFIDGPNYPIVATANEVSGTISLFSVDVDIAPTEACEIAIDRTSEDELMITGLEDYTSAVYIYDGNYEAIFTCESWNEVCNATEILNNLPAGFYHVYAQTWDATWDQRCNIYSLLFVGDNDEEVVYSSASNREEFSLPKILDQEKEVEVFPNPASNFVNIQTNELSGLAGTIEVSTAIGQQISFQYYDALPEREKMNIKSLAKGTYLVTLTTDNEISVSKIFVKQ